MTSRSEFGWFVHRFYQQGTGVEVGTQHGVFAKQIAKGWCGNIYCVDLWPDEEIFEVAQSNMDGPRFKLFRGDSVETAAQFVDGGFDWVYIDADHHYENVKRDIEAWYPKVRAGGIVAGHDYVDYLDMGVIQAVNEFAAEHGYEVGLTTEDPPWNGVQFPTWWFQKRAENDGKITTFGREYMATSDG